MGVQKDAGELLIFFYDELINKGEGSVGTQDVLDATKWESNRLNSAYHYLDDLGLLKGTGSIGNIKGAHIFDVMRLFPEGINIVENKPKFKETFGYEINLGLVKFSWSTTEK